MRAVKREFSARTRLRLLARLGTVPDWGSFCDNGMLKEAIAMFNRIHNSTLVVLGTIVALNFAAGLPPAVAQCELAKLAASDGAPGDSFGRSVAISGSVTIVGAWMDDDNGTDSGSAYVFRYNGSNWVQEAKLLPFDGAAGDNFGSAVAITGDLAIVGARLDDVSADDSGSAYVFRYNGSAWEEEAKLLANDASSWAYFGHSVAIDGSAIAIGAPGLYVDGDVRTGAAYVFRWNGSSSWSEETRLLAPDLVYLDSFGRAVTIKGDVTIVGSFLDDDMGIDSGSAYVFRRVGSSWVLEAKLHAADGAAGDEFGHRLALSGTNVVIGARYDDDRGANSGSAYVFSFDGSTWAQAAKLTAPDGGAGDEFGLGVAIDGETVLIGARYDDDNGTDSGSAYVFGLVEDTTPPALTCSVGTDVLWSPDHHLENVELTTTVSDECDPVGAAEFLIIEVWSDETEVPGTGDGTGRHCPDAKDIYTGLRLRNERRAAEDGRVYLIIARAEDGGGNVGFGYCAVVVPHDQSEDGLAEVAAQAEAALATVASTPGTTIAEKVAPLGYTQHGVSEELGPHQ